MFIFFFLQLSVAFPIPLNLNYFCFVLQGDIDEEIHETDSEFPNSDCEQDDEEVEDEEEDDDESDEEASDDDDDGSGDGDGSEGSGEITDDESVDIIQPNTRLEALFEAAGMRTGNVFPISSHTVAQQPTNDTVSFVSEVGNENDPALRNVNLALNDAAQELNRMRTETSSRDRK